MHTFYETKGIVEDSPFNQLILAEMERERLYQSFVLIDEYDEIARAWLDFSDFCAKSLLNLTNLANLIYQRYLDEFNRDKEQISTDESRRELITKRIEKLQQFQMEAAILMSLYADIVNTGVFDIKSNRTCNLKVEGYKVLEKISSTYFDSTHPRSSSIEEIMLTFFLLNQKQIIIDLMEENIENVEQKDLWLTEKGKYERALAHFDAYFVAKLLRQINWWWYDPIAIHFAYSRALGHLNEAIKSYDYTSSKLSPIVEQIKTDDIPLNQAKKNRVLIDHFNRLVMEAAKQNIFVASIEYINIIKGLQKEIVDYTKTSNKLSKVNEDEELLDITERPDIKYDLFQNIAKLATITTKILVNYETITKEALLNYIEEIEKLTEDSSFSANFQYISELPFVYQNFALKAKLLLSGKGYTIKEIIDGSSRSFKRYINRLKQSMEDISLDIYTKKSNSKLSVRDIEETISLVDNVKCASYFLPQLEEKVDLTKEVESLEYYIRSVHVLLTNDLSNLSEIENLIIHSKAHYYSSKALEIAQSKSTNLIPLEWISERFNETFIDGKEKELKLFELGRQYLFLNVVIDEVANGFELANKIVDISINKNYNKIFDLLFKHFEPFEIINKQISGNCNQSLEHKQIIGKIDFDVKWQIIEIKKILADITVLITSAIKDGIMGYALISHKSNNKAATLFKGAYDKVNEVSLKLEKLAKIDETFAELAKIAYKFGLFYKDLERRARERLALQSYPLEEVLSFMKKIVFFV